MLYCDLINYKIISSAAIINYVILPMVRVIFLTRFDILLSQTVSILSQVSYECCYLSIGEFKNLIDG